RRAGGCTGGTMRVSEPRRMTADGTGRSSVRQLDRPSAPASVVAPSPDTGGRSVLEGAFGLLGAVERAGEASLTQLAAQCGLPKTTTYRLLEQLMELRAVERSGAGYRLGSRLFRLGQAWQPYPGLRS